ncbi:hypothetical protein [Haloferula sargassicola]|uniref:Uncharacterized protein n=1 Tax=Haloferula sargassicola TaxID=490096 RepID=A0ABP9UQC3_9BACT
MSDETPEAHAAASENAEPQAKPAKKAARKTARKRAAKKAPKAGGDEVAAAPEAPSKAPAESTPAEPVKESAPRPQESRSDHSDHTDSDDQVPVMQEPPGPEGGSGKRRRRRRRRGGSGEEGPGNDKPVQRPHLDHDLVAKKAWRIFLAEVSEEGLALIGDNDARELSRRSFRLAELFLEEAARHQ